MKNGEFDTRLDTGRFGVPTRPTRSSAGAFPADNSLSGVPAVLGVPVSALAPPADSRCGGSSGDCFAEAPATTVAASFERLPSGSEL